MLVYTVFLVEIRPYLKILDEIGHCSSSIFFCFIISFFVEEKQKCIIAGYTSFLKGIN